MPDTDTNSTQHWAEFWRKERLQARKLLKCFVAFTIIFVLAGSITLGVTLPAFHKSIEKYHWGTCNTTSPLNIVTTPFERIQGFASFTQLNTNCTWTNYLLFECDNPKSKYFANCVVINTNSYQHEWSCVYVDNECIPDISNIPKYESTHGFGMVLTFFSLAFVCFVMIGLVGIHA